MDEFKVTEKAFQLGLAYEKIFRGCAQGAVAAIQDALEIREDTVYKCASGLAAGIGQCTDGSCGAYTGGVLMLSLLFGRSREDEPSAQGTKCKQDSARLASSLHDRFMEEYGSVRCSDIHRNLFGRTFDLRSSKGKQEFDDAGAHSEDTKCGSVVGKGARWTVELIEEELSRRDMNLSGLKSVRSQDEDAKS
jgi:C_GCAxxG_C_C family probable redox protein